MANAKVQVRRAYEDPAEGDATRVLVDRIWPRGLTKARAALDEVVQGCRAVTDCVNGTATIRSASGNSAAATRRNWQSRNGPGRWRHLRELASGRGVTC